MPKRPLRLVSGVPKRECGSMAGKEERCTTPPQQWRHSVKLRQKGMNPFVRRDGAAAGRDPRARGADGAHLLRRLLGNGRHPEPVHDRDGAREPRALGARVHLLVDRDGVEDYLEFGEKKFADGPDGLPGLGEHQHPGRGAEEARRHHERRAQERPALHGPHGRAGLRGGGRARRGRRRHRGEVPEGGARREDAR